MPDDNYPRAKRRGSIEAHSLLDEMVLYSPDNDTAFSLNRSARSVWELCDGKHSLNEIARILADKFGVTPDAMLPEIMPILYHFNELNLVDLDGAVLQCQHQKKVFSLNRSAHAIWEMCDGSHSVEQISERLAEDYQLLVETILPDIQKTITQLMDCGLLKTGDGLFPARKATMDDG